MSTSAVTVEVYCVNKSESQCMLFDVSLCSTLKELRLRAEQEVGQLLPKSGFHFMMEKELVEQDAESLLTVEKVAKGIGRVGEDDYRIDIMEESQLEEEELGKAREERKAFVGESESSGADGEESWSQEKEEDLERSGEEREKAIIEIDGESESLGTAGKYKGASGKDKEGVKAEEQEGPAVSVWEKLRSPDSCQVRGIKIYKVAEIEEAVGKEKERRIFWNKKAKEMHKTITDKQKLYDHIHQAWRLHKAERTGEGSGKLKQSTLAKNVERVQQAKQRCATLQDEISEMKKARSVTNEQKATIKRLHVSLRAARSELRLAQDAHRKNAKKTFNNNM